MTIVYIMLGVMIVIVFFYLGALFGYKIGLDQNKVQEAYKKTIEKSIEQIKNMIYASIEVENKMFYLYDRSNGNFICQGKTYNELIHNIKARFPDKTVVIDKNEAIEKGLL